MNFKYLKISLLLNFRYKKKVNPIKIEDNRRNLIKTEIEFRKEIGNIKGISDIGFGSVDEREVFIVTLLPETPIPNEIPPDFRNYPVLIDYGIVKGFHRNYHYLLELGISIGDINEVNACTLGLVTKLRSDLEKNYILTTKHGVGPVDTLVCQPGKIDLVNGMTSQDCANVTQYHCLEVDQDDHIIDYAFCEIKDNGRVNKIPNELCGLKRSIGSFDTSVNGTSGRIIKVEKVGRTTYHTRGDMCDLWVGFMSNNFNPPRRLVALKVNGDEKAFGEPGDSGSPVFDIDNKLVGILQSGVENRPYVYIIPINIIIEHMRNFHRMEFELA
ncbi:21348_t:CDS:2 [Dentiscutata erythropus]|uniref:21348_t:CDS:1 n=1 Tax=Dentiscutata erythropus TaxID=1348616 RepID=A0A9N9GP45_9GLOM|nr:21348_t:CDS:2 [Dentiscutata erythropus]